MKVLIADDNELTRERVAAAVTKWGYKAIAVPDGIAAWKALSSETSPPLAILDWYMPGMNGPEICRRIRKAPRQTYTFVILLTSGGDQQRLVEGLKAGADDFVCKPFDGAELEQRVRTGRRLIGLHDDLLRAQEELRILATRDALTGVWNRREILRFLDEKYAQVAREPHPLGLMLIDVDHFKSVNDTCGHLAGDDVLRQVASVINSQVRHADQVGRFGGEEFLVVLPGADLETCAKIGERIRRSIFAACRLTNGQLDRHLTAAESPPAASYNASGHRGAQSVRSISVSIGVACIQEGATLSISDAVAQCDNALYRAKHMGRNRVCRAEPFPQASPSPCS